MMSCLMKREDGGVATTCVLMYSATPLCCCFLASREYRLDGQRERESVPQGALTTLRTVVCVERVPLSFQEIRFYSSDQSHSFSSEIMHTNTHLHARRYIQTDKHTSIVPPLIIPQSADSRVI